MNITPKEIELLTQYIQKKFGNKDLRFVKGLSEDSVELLLKDEFIGTIYKDDDNGDVSYDLNISILDFDLKNS